MPLAINNYELGMTNYELLFATNNLHKLREIQEIVGDSMKIKSLTEIGFEGEIQETQDTIEGNALQKARYIFDKTGLDCFADDTGLEIDVLDGRPGVFSARYAGEACNFDDNIRKVLTEMEDAGNRRARFRCVVTLILKGIEYSFEGKVEGIIIREKRGEEGFGYDPIFLPDGFDQTFAEMAPYLKNGISHRGKAVTRMIRFLEKL
jgi:XTP/dITP diphosphohydrolase